MTQGSLALTGNRSSRAAGGVMLSGVTRMPFDGYMGEGVDTADYLDRMLGDASSGMDIPAAIIVETVQSEGGINVASFEWLKKIAGVARKHGVLFIIDDIQTGNGRMGTFFSFEEAGIVPDIVCLSKAIGGMGLPMSLVLFRPELDVLKPGQHNGTFRGHNLAFVAAKAALDMWRDPDFAEGIKARAQAVRARLEQIVGEVPGAWRACARPRSDARHLMGRSVHRGPGVQGRVQQPADHRDLWFGGSGSETPAAAHDHR